MGILDQKGCLYTRLLSDNCTHYCTPLPFFSMFSVAARFLDRNAVRSNPDNPQTAGDAFADEAKALMQRESEIKIITAVQSAALLTWPLKSGSESIA